MSINILLLIFIAYQSYKVYLLQNRVKHLENTGQLKCIKP